jgi:uncharacterized protein involved in exopolysaccharide biosynthesis
MTEEDQGSVRKGQHGQTAGVDTPRRGPVIRTSDFVTAPRAVRPQAPDPQDHGPVSERLARLARDPRDAWPHEGETVERQPERTHAPEPPARAAPDFEQRVAAPSEAATVAQPRIPAPEQPIIDAGMILAAAWRHRLVILVLVVLLAALGGFASTMLPRKFSATATLYFEPRQVRIDDPSPPPLQQEAVLAMIDSQSQILVSRRVLAAAARDLALAKDPEFGGVPAAMSARLSKAVTVEREDNTYVVNLTVKSSDADKSAAIANGIVKAFTTEQEQAAAGDYDSTSTALDTRLSDLAAQLKQAEQAAADFRVQNNIESAATEDPDQAKRTASLEELLLTAQSRTIAAKARYDAVSKFQVADLVAGAAPAEGVATTSSNTLTQLQQQYGNAAATVSNLETKLGSRHPQLVAARATLSSVSDAIRGEIGRMTTAAQADYERARAEEDAVARELSVQKALDNNKSGPLIEYRELRRKADAARQIYETVLKRSRQSSEEQRLVKSNVRVISPAEPAIQADGPSRSILLVACTFGGLIAGLMLGLLYAVIRLFISRVRASA